MSSWLPCPRQPRVAWLKRLHGSRPTQWLQESEFYGDVMRVDGYHSLLGGILTARSLTLLSQSTALPIRPSRKPARSPHQPAHPFAFDSLPLCMLSGRSHAHGHPVAFMGVRGSPRPPQL